MPSTRSQTRRQAPTRTNSSSRLTQSAAVSKKSQNRPALSRQNSHSKQRSAATSARVITTGTSGIPSSALSSTSSAAASPRQPTFPELVRQRVAYSPAPARFHANDDDSHGRHHRRQHMQWPSQIHASVSPSASISSAASSLSNGRSDSQDRPELQAYAALLQGALRKARESTASPGA